MRQHMWGLLTVAAIVHWMVAGTTMGAVVVDFQGIGATEGAALTNQIPGLTFSNTILAKAGDRTPANRFAFSTNMGGFDTGDASPFNIPDNWFITDAILQGDDFGDDPGTDITVVFDDPVYDLSFLAADIEAYNGGGEILTATVYSDADGLSLLDTQTLDFNDPGTGDRSVVGVGFSGISGIKMLVIDVNTADSTTTDRFAFGVDNLTYSVIPEPASVAVWALLGAAGIGVGCWRRRKR